MTIRFLLFLSLCFTSSCFAQKTNTSNSPSSDKDAFMLREIHNTALTQGKSYEWLSYLTEEIGGRLSGTPEAAAAVEYTYQMLDSMNLDSVWRQPCMVPHWSRGEKEVVRVVNSAMGSFDLNAVALGNSEGTGPVGVSAEIVELTNLEQVDELGEKLRGKIAFYNQAMDPTQLSTFAAYGGAAGARVYGATRAAKYGAVGSIVRSLTLRQDDVPHTGSNRYEEAYAKIPAIAVSTNDANKLHNLLQQGSVSVYIQNTSTMLPDKQSYNVIGEIRGSEHPDEIILVGGHLDSWDLGTGAHDDGAGCVHAMDVLQVLKRLNYQPKRTLRCVLFMNEENGLRGATEYQKESNRKGEFHLAAIESDRGGFVPRGFTADGDPSVFTERFAKAIKWLPLLEPYHLYFEKGGSGADINGLKSQKGLLFGFKPDSQRYFDYHHTPIDGLDVVNKRELELGVAAIASLVYLIDQHGL